MFPEIRMLVYHTRSQKTSFFGGISENIPPRLKFSSPAPAKSRPLFDKSTSPYYNEDMDNLILIGMPSAGKSTAGVLLAKRIGFGFIDCDLIIQNEERALLSDIIEARGAEGFLAIEERVNIGLYASRCVIATVLSWRIW